MVEDGMRIYVIKNNVTLTTSKLEARIQAHTWV